MHRKTIKPFVYLEHIKDEKGHILSYQLFVKIFSDNSLLTVKTPPNPALLSPDNTTRIFEFEIEEDENSTSRTPIEYDVNIPAASIVPPEFKFYVKLILEDHEHLGSVTHDGSSVVHLGDPD